MLLPKEDAPTFKVISAETAAKYALKEWSRFILDHPYSKQDGPREEKFLQAVEKLREAMAEYRKDEEIKRAAVEETKINPLDVCRAVLEFCPVQPNNNSKEP